MYKCRCAILSTLLISSISLYPLHPPANIFNCYYVYYLQQKDFIKTYMSLLLWAVQHVLRLGISSLWQMPSSLTPTAKIRIREKKYFSRFWASVFRPCGNCCINVVKRIEHFNLDFPSCICILIDFNACCIYSRLLSANLFDRPFN